MLEILAKGLPVVNQQLRVVSTGANFHQEVSAPEQLEMLLAVADHVC